MRAHLDKKDKKVNLSTHQQVHANALSIQNVCMKYGGYFLATVYAATWDLVVDFGLLGFKSRRCLFPRFSYIVVAILDVYLRSTWLLTYQPDCRAYVGASTFNKECFAFLISSLVSKPHLDILWRMTSCQSPWRM